MTKPIANCYGATRPEQPCPCPACQPDTAQDAQRDLSHIAAYLGSSGAPQPLVERLKAAASYIARTDPDKTGVGRNAARYVAWRDAMVAQDQKFIDAMALALPAAVGHSREPTAEEWDTAIDKAAGLPTTGAPA